MDLPNFATYRFPYLVKFTLNKLTVTTKYIHVITWIWLYEYEFVFHNYTQSCILPYSWSLIYPHLESWKSMTQHLKFHKYLVWIFFSFLISTCIYHIRRDLEKHLPVKFNAKVYVLRSFFVHCTCILIKF